MARGTEQLPAGDVVRLLAEQHTRIRELFGEIRDTSGEPKRELLGQLRRTLVAHETAEEMIVRPVTRAIPGGNRVAADRNAEEAEATQLLAGLDRTSPSDPGFAAALTRLEESVTRHARREETDEFPLLLATRSGPERMAMGLTLQAARLLAPTHPHNSTAGSTAAQYVFGPVASVLDHVRDAAERLLPH